MTTEDLSRLLKDAITAGAGKALAESGELGNTLTKAQACPLSAGILWTGGV